MFFKLLGEGKGKSSPGLSHGDIVGVSVLVASGRLHAVFFLLRFLKDILHKGTPSVWRCCY